jgi:hypothetical protein
MKNAQQGAPLPQPYLTLDGANTEGVTAVILVPALLKCQAELWTLGLALDRFLLFGSAPGLRAGIRRGKNRKT